MCKGMSSSLEAEELEEPEFAWGKKRGIGGRKKDVQFYESFNYDGVEYTLYDCVYMYKQGEPAPYIGKLVKIWENADKSKRIKVHWFFRPTEIAYYLKDTEVLVKELFLASGDGNGLANVNPLEAIAGKCNVVCISKDSRNPQPSVEELQMADYVFYRMFDVKSCIISDQMDDTVGGLEVKFVFNRRESGRTLDVCKLGLNSKDEGREMIACKETLKLAGESSPQQLNNVKLDENGNCMLEKGDDNLKKVQVKLESSLGDCSSGVDMSANKNRETTVTTTEKRSAFTDKNVGFKVSGEKDKSKEKSRSGHTEDAVGLEKDAKLTKDLNALQGKLSKTYALPPVEKSESAHAKDSVGPEKDKELGENLSACRERPSTTNIVSSSETLRPSMTNVSPNETSKLGSNKNFEGFGQDAKFVKSSSGSMKRPLKTSVDLSKEKLNPRNDACHKSKDTTLAKDSCSMEGGPPKKAKFDDSVKTSADNKNDTIKKLKEQTYVRETKNSPMLVTSHGNKAKPTLGKGALKEHHSGKMGEHSSDNLPNPSTTMFEDDAGKVGGQVFEVTQRPNVEKNKWIKLPWEERMKTAHDQGRLVLLQNLDPEYTSGEVEDIIWHAFKENCTAKMLQHTAISNPHMGQAFVIFKTREAVDRVVKKLDDGCLMLPNRRPLVVCTGAFPKFEKQTTFVGHLAIDKARRQIQREMKEAVSTSHYSQNNTIEYEMAMSWCLLQSKSDKWWEKLYQEQWKELNKLKNDLKSK